MSKQFAQKLKMFRLENKMKQSDLAKIIGVSTMTVCHWEKSDSEPDISTINKLAKIFNVSIDELIGEDY